MAITSYSTKRKIPDGDYCGKCAWLCTRSTAKCSHWEEYKAPPEIPQPTTNDETREP